MVLVHGNNDFRNEFLQLDLYRTIVNMLIYAPYNTALTLQQIGEIKQERFTIDLISYVPTLKKLKSKHSNQMHLLNDGRLSMVLESTGGHCDNFTGASNIEFDDSVIESKITLMSGKVHKFHKGKSSDNFVHVALPLGSLAYPRYGVFTNCNPVSDIECH